MPQYEYECPECGARETVLYLVYPEQEVCPTCPKCGVKMVRVISNFSFTFREWKS